MAEISEATVELVHRTAERYRNWGKWGPDDELGTLNYITPEKVIAAAGLVRKGQVVSLALPFDKDGPQTGLRGRTNPAHLMLQSGTDVLEGVRDLPHGFGSADDLVTMPLQCGTQWDGLGHIFDRGKMWNGYSAGEVSTFFGAARNGIQNMRDRLVTRGVLLDLARYAGVESLEPGHEITEEDLLACIEAQGPSSQVTTGDAVLVRTGQLGVCRRDGWGTYAGGDAPGLGFATAGWLHRSEIAALATDTWGVEVRPNMEGCFQPLHQVMIPNIGLTVGEIFALDELGEACASDGCYEFLFVGGPLPFTAAVGSPANPQAIR